MTRRRCVRWCGSGSMASSRTNRATSTRWCGTGVSPAPVPPKDMVNNKFPFSRDCGNGAVVPLGKVIIKNDFHVLFEIGGVFAPRFIHLVQNPYCHAQARRSLRPCDEVLCDVHGVKDHPLAGTWHVRR